MPDDDIDKNEPDSEVDSDERDTEVSLPPDHLLNEARRSEVKAEANTPRKQLPKESMRMGMSGPGDSSDFTKKAIFVGIPLVVFLLVLFGLNLYFQKKLSNLEKKLSDLTLELTVSHDGAKRCVDELSECIHDFDASNETKIPTGLSPRSFLLEKKRKQKEMTSAAFDQQQEQIIGRLESMKNPKGQSRKFWKALREEINEFRKFEKAEKKARAEYLTALKGSMIPSDGTPDPALAKRNKERAAYLAELKSSP